MLNILDKAKEIEDYIFKCEVRTPSNIKMFFKRDTLDLLLGVFYTLVLYF